jgi:predicted Zn-dependent protease
MYFWNLDQLKQVLQQRAELKDWLIISEGVRRCERYFLMDGETFATDQDRETSQSSVNLRVFVRKPDAKGRQGETTKRLNRMQPLLPQVDAAISAALLTDHAEWALTLPSPTTIAQPLQSFDPAIIEDIHGVMDALTDRIEKALGAHREAQFNSAELFVSEHDREYAYSNGFIYRVKQTRVYTEVAFSANKGGVSDEYLETRWSVHASDLPVEELCRTAAERAVWMLQVQKPTTMSLPVLVDSEVLMTLLNGHISQLSGANRYHELPHVRAGAPLIPGAIGDLMTLSLDPSLPGGADTVAFSGDGVPQEKRTLVKDNVVLEMSIDQQHGQYLGEAPTVVRGTLVLEGGTRTKVQLLQSAPRVLEILQFSGLFADENSGTFSSEIRLALLHDRSTGSMTALKGGSLSGSFHENFKDLKLSAEMAHRCHFESNGITGSGYRGPAWALLSDVSITGGE